MQTLDQEKNESDRPDACLGHALADSEESLGEEVEQALLRRDPDQVHLRRKKKERLSDDRSVEKLRPGGKARNTSDTERD